MRAHELCERLGERLQSFAVLFGLWTLHLFEANFVRLMNSQSRLCAGPGARGFFVSGVRPRRFGEQSYNMGKLTFAREHLEATISLYDPERDRVHAGSPCLYRP